MLIEDKTKTETPRQKDALRLKALPIVLGSILLEEYSYLALEDVIYGHHLMESVGDRLQLETPDSRRELWAEVNLLMCQWNWRWVQLDCGTDIYLMPMRRDAGTIEIAGQNLVLQSYRYFPEDISDIYDPLWQSEFAAAINEKRAIEDTSGHQLLMMYLAQHHTKPPASEIR